MKRINLYQIIENKEKKNAFNNTQTHTEFCKVISNNSQISVFKVS